MLARMYMAGDGRIRASASPGPAIPERGGSNRRLVDCLRDAFTGYIGWEELMANQKRLSDNLCRYQEGQRGVARKGSALLQGLVVCGRCGRRMGLRYSGPDANYPVYQCTADRDHSALPRCQEVRALPVDAEVERLMLERSNPIGSPWRLRP